MSHVPGRHHRETTGLGGGWSQEDDWCGIKRDWNLLYFDSDEHKQLDGGLAYRRKHGPSQVRMEATMTTRIRVSIVVALAALTGACTLPGVAPPTPFTFPTPNLTLTAVFAPLSSPTPLLPTLPPLATVTLPAASPTPTATPLATFTPLPTSTSYLPSPTPAPTSTPKPPPTAVPTAPSERPNGSPKTAEYLSAPPTIDGDLTDWSITSYNIKKIVFGASNWTDTSDASAIYYIGWDSNNLYVAISVTDDTFVQISQGSQLYKGDSAEIQLDRQLRKDFYSTYLSADDFQIGLSPGDFGGLTPEAFLWYPIGDRGPLGSATVAALQTIQGYDIEASIPWSVFGGAPNSGKHYGFAISVSDNDKPGEADQESMVSSVATRTLVDPTTWGTLIMGSP